MSARNDWQNIGWTVLAIPWSSISANCNASRGPFHIEKGLYLSSENVYIQQVQSFLLTAIWAVNKGKR